MYLPGCPSLTDSEVKRNVDIVFACFEDNDGEEEDSGILAKAVTALKSNGVIKSNKNSNDDKRFIC